MTSYPHSYRTPLRRSLLVALVGIAVVLPNIAVGATPPPPMTAQVAPLPPNAATVPQAILNGVYCTSVGNCVAVGRYESGDKSEALIETETKGVWSSPITILMPTNALSYAFGVLNGVTCTSLGNCVAVGQYQTRKSMGVAPYTVIDMPLIVTEVKGKWGHGIEAPQPAGAQQGTVTALNAVSCPVANGCIAVGQFITAEGNKGFTVQFFKNKWYAPKVTLLPNWALSNFITQLDGVSCVVFGFCVAVGQFVNGAPGRQALAVLEIHGVWQVGHAVPLPTTVRDPWAGLFSIKCHVWGSCVAVGVFSGLPAGGQGLLETMTVGRWVGTMAARPKGDSGFTESDQLLGVSCSSVGTCDAVGQFTDGEIDFGISINEVGGKWGAATIVPRPKDAAKPPYTGLNGVFCSNKVVCVMVGQYQSSLGEPALIVTK